jgi:hypothetical protein
MAWNHQELLEKAQRYFSRAAHHDGVDEEFALWLLLGLEFLLRVPLARVSPLLLAATDHEGSLLLAAGITKPDVQPKSLRITAVVERLKYVITDFGQDRVSDANFLLNLRNSELHTSDASLANLPEDTWLPRFLSVTEAITSHIEVPLEDLLSTDIITQARALRVKVDRAIEKDARALISAARDFFDRLTPEEIEERRRANFFIPPSGNKQRPIECPACKSSAVLELTPGRTTGSRFDEVTNSFTYTVMYVAESLDCRVCGLSLLDTARVRAAGIPRLQQETHTEGRYEGWESNIEDEELEEKGFYLVELDHDRHG